MTKPLESQTLESMVHGLAEWHPCLICGTRTAGPKGGTVCPGCRQKVADYDAMGTRLREATVGATPVVVSLPNRQVDLPPRMPPAIARELGEAFAQLWAGYPLATQADAALPIRTMRDALEGLCSDKRYLSETHGRPVPLQPVGRVVPAFQADAMLRLEWHLRRVAEAAFAAGRESTPKAGAARTAPPDSPPPGSDDGAGRAEA